MSCESCKYFHKIGRRTNGEWVWSKNEGGWFLGWCQYLPPIALSDGKTKWPTVPESEGCGQYSEKHIPSWYKRQYEDACYTVGKLSKEVARYKVLHKAIGELGPLVGKKKSAVRLQIIKAIQCKLAEKGRTK